MNSFKLVMIVLLKIYAAGKIFGKNGLKAIRDTFFSNTWSVFRGGTGGPNFLVDDIQQNWKVQTFSLAGRAPPPIPSLNMRS